MIGGHVGQPDMHREGLGVAILTEHHALDGPLERQDRLPMLAAEIDAHQLARLAQCEPSFGLAFDRDQPHEIGEGRVEGDIAVLEPKLGRSLLNSRPSAIESSIANAGTDFSVAGSADLHERWGADIGTRWTTPLVLGADAGEKTNPLGDVRFGEQVDAALRDVWRIIRTARDLDRSSVPLRPRP